ncbi:MAG TPA: hypothetical protein VJH71_03375 [Candidatus Paceibacterota bacterium]
MKGIMGIRIEPISKNMVAIDITCGCGRNGLKNENTGEVGFHHSILVGDRRTSASPAFICRCGQRFNVVSQGDHFHVNSVSG